MDSRLRWQGKEWDIIGTPWMLNSGMMLRLRKVDGGRASICGWRQTAWMLQSGEICAGWCCNSRRRSKLS
jgi:toxin CptA